MSISNKLLSEYAINMFTGISNMWVKIHPKPNILGKYRKKLAQLKCEKCGKNLEEEPVFYSHTGSCRIKLYCQKCYEKLWLEPEESPLTIPA